MPTTSELGRGSLDENHSPRFQPDDTLILPVRELLIHRNFVIENYYSLCGGLNCVPSPKYVETLTPL